MVSTSETAQERIKVEHDEVDFVHLQALVRQISTRPAGRLGSVALNFDGITDEALCQSSLLSAIAQAEVPTLELFGNRIGMSQTHSFCKTLGHYLRCSFLPLTTLKLGGNQITDQGACFIALGLASNSTLTQLNLCNNMIGDFGIHNLVGALKENSTLTSLVLRKNRFGPAALCDLCSLLCDPNCQLAELQVKHNSLGSNSVISSHGPRAAGGYSVLPQMPWEVLSLGVKALVNAVAVNQTLQVLDLEQTLLTAPDARELAEALKANTVIHAVNLNDNGIGDTGAAAFGALLKVNTAITTLGMRNNRITATGCALLFSGMEGTARLTGLDIAGNEISDEGVLTISGILSHNTTLRSLDVHGNRITTQGMTHMAMMLADQNTTMTHLDISANYCGNEVAARWADVIVRNTALTRLSLDNCEITRGNALLQAIQRNTTLCYFGCGGKRNAIPKTVKSAINHYTHRNLTFRQPQHQHQHQDQPPQQEQDEVVLMNSVIEQTSNPQVRRLSGFITPLTPTVVSSTRSYGSGHGSEDLTEELSDCTTTPTAPGTQSVTGTPKCMTSSVATCATTSQQSVPRATIPWNIATPLPPIALSSSCSNSRTNCFGPQSAPVLYHFTHTPPSNTYYRRCLAPPFIQPASSSSWRQYATTPPVHQSEKHITRKAWPSANSGSNSKFGIHQLTSAATAAATTAAAAAAAAVVTTITTNQTNSAISASWRSPANHVPTNPLGTSLQFDSNLIGSTRGCVSPFVSMKGSIWAASKTATPPTTTTSTLFRKIPETLPVARQLTFNSPNYNGDDTGDEVEKEEQVEETRSTTAPGWEAWLPVFRAGSVSSLTSQSTTVKVVSSPIVVGELDEKAFPTLKNLTTTTTTATTSGTTFTPNFSQQENGKESPTDRLPSPQNGWVPTPCLTTTPTTTTTPEIEQPQEMVTQAIAPIQAIHQFSNVWFCRVWNCALDE